MGENNIGHRASTCLYPRHGQGLTPTVEISEPPRYVQLDTHAKPNHREGRLDMGEGELPP